MGTLIAVRINRIKNFANAEENDCTPFKYMKITQVLLYCKELKHQPGTRVHWMNKYVSLKIIYLKPRQVRNN